MCRGFFYKLILIKIFFALPQVYAEKNITINTLAGYAPYAFNYEKGEALKKGLSYKEKIKPGSDTGALQGLAWDIVRESLHSMGYTIKLNVLPWARSLKEMKKGKVDALFPATKTLKRLKFFTIQKMRQIAQVQVITQR